MARVTEKERSKYEIYRELEALATEMNYTVDVVIVEGGHDKKTLKLLGYKKQIFLCSKLSHNELVDLTAEKYSNVVVLTDFDEQGINLNKKLSNLLEKRRVKVDRFYRRRFLQLLKEARVLTIEGIYNLKLDLFK